MRRRPGTGGAGGRLAFIAKDIMKIRVAIPSDAEGIGRVHVDSWRTTYRDLLPADFLAGLSYESRAQTWADTISQHSDRNFIFVLENDGNEIVGFVACGPEREGQHGHDGEIYAIYLLQEVQGQGWGKALFRKATEELKGRGYGAMLLWVLEGNPSRGFYEAMGGKTLAEKEIGIGGVKRVEVAYGWEEI